MADSAGQEGSAVFPCGQALKLKEQGERLLANSKHGEAIKALSDALKLATEPQEKAHIMLIRSQAFTGMSQWLRSIPAEESEQSAILGLDPTALAQLGLRDAKGAAKLEPKLVNCYAQQGIAETLLEHYVEAQEAYLEGLSVDPLNTDLQNGLKNVRQHLSGSRPSSPAPASAGAKRRRAGSAEDAECGLCMKLLYEPVTTPCGHSFCRNCFLRATDHGNKCPYCRTVLHVGKDIPVTLALRQLIEKSFPEEYQQRRQEEQAAADVSGGGEAPLPLFVMSCCLPNEKMRLQVFEPRYRLMTRRCMEGSRRFGMAQIGAGHQLNPIAVEVDITDCQPLNDGRFLLEIRGRRRFRIERSWEQDGYRVAQPGYFHDTAAEPGSADAEEAEAVAEDCLKRTASLIDQLGGSSMALGSRGPSTEVIDLLRRAAERPLRNDYEGLSFWVANLLPIETPDRLKLLAMTSSLERLKHVRALLDPHHLGRSCMLM